MSHGLVSLEQVFHSVKLHAMSGMWRRGKGGGGVGRTGWGSEGDIISSL